MKKGTDFQISHHFYPTDINKKVQIILILGKMNIIATLVSNSRTAYKILREVPENSVVLFPESVDLNRSIVNKYSKDRELFIIYNEDTVQNGKRYITMKGIDNGRQKWQVSKFMLYKTDVEDGYTASRSQFIVDIRSYKSALFICKDLITIGRDGHLSAVGNVLKNYKTEILLLPANWIYNFGLVENTIDTAMGKIRSLKAGLLSCTNTFAIAKTQNKNIRVQNFGWKAIEIS